MRSKSDDFIDEWKAKRIIELEQVAATHSRLYRKLTFWH